MQLIEYQNSQQTQLVSQLGYITSKLFANCTGWFEAEHRKVVLWISISLKLWDAHRMKMLLRL